MTHIHDSCTPDITRDLIVSGLTDVPSHRNRYSHDLSGPEDDLRPESEVSPVFTVTPFSLDSEVVARSAQVPVVVLIGSPVDPGMSALRRTLVTAASGAGLHWILAIVDADRFPQVVAAFRPATQPSVTVVADGTGVASWSPADALGDDGVDCTDWVSTVVSTVAGRLTGLPEDAVIRADDATGVPVNSIGGSSPDRRLAQAASCVAQGDPAGAVDIYDAMLSEDIDGDTTAVLLRARAAVAVLARTSGLDQGEALALLARAGSRVPAGVEELLVTADIFVLADREDEAVDLLSGSLTRWDDADRRLIGTRLIDLCRLAAPGSMAVARARTRLGNALL